MKKAHYRFSATVCFVFVILALANAGCGSESSEYPPPGKMRVVSVTPLQVQTKNNLIGNGNFAKWWPGSPVGEGFGAPDAEFSSVNRGGDAEHVSAVQTWTKADADLDGASLFRTQVKNLKPNTLYRLTVSASGQIGGSVALSVYAQQGAETSPLIPNLITLMPTAQEGAVKQYTADFQVDEASSILIASRLVSAGTGQSVVTWREWRLYPVEAAQ